MVPALSCCAQVAGIPSSDLPAVADPSSADGSYSPADSAEFPSWSGDLHTRSPQRRWILNSDWGVTDGNPNPIRWFANFSLVGNSPFLDRENDTIGLGYYHLGVSGGPFLTSLGFEAEDGLELFYNAAVTPGFTSRLTSKSSTHPGEAPKRPS